MCLIAFAIGARPDLPLVIASNRDEQWSRPTQALRAWALPSGKLAYSGQDLQAGGTWLGLAQDGRVALLTNVRSGTPNSAPRSRGKLVNSWLDARSDWEDWLPRFDPRQYGGFNLVLGDLSRGRWAWVSNRASEAVRPADADGSCRQAMTAGWHGRRLGPGLYGLSNAALDTPWPKTVALKRALQRHIDAGAKADDSGDLLNALLDRVPASDAELPSTGIALDIEKALSSAFVHAPAIGYGTRSSLLVHCHADGRLDAREWTHETGTHAMPAGRPARWPLANSRCSSLESVLTLTGTQHSQRL
jgi:uncharacterized protein with NRDE domain